MLHFITLPRCREFCFKPITVGVGGGGEGVLPYKRCSLFNIRYITVTYLGSFAKITYLPKSDSDRSIESVICHRIYYSGVGALRGQRHIPSKC